MYKNYIITKFKGKYRLYDVLAIEMEDFMNSYNGHHKIVIDKQQKVYHKYEYEEVDDWYADIGAITHTENAKNI